MRRFIPNLDDVVVAEPITHRNTVTVDCVRVIFAATDSKKVIIAVQSVQHPEHFTVFINMQELQLGIWADEIKSAFKKMAKKYRQFYSNKPENQPTDAVVIDYYGSRYKVTFSDYDGYQMASFRCVEIRRGGGLYESVHMFGYVRNDIEKMMLAWPLLSDSQRLRYIKIAKEFECPMSRIEFYV